MSENSTLQELLSVSASKYFDDYTLKKSEKYLLGVRITNYHVVDNSFVMANISGTTKYLTSITVVDGKLSFKCNCPKQGKCKHEAALFKYAQNKLGLKINENTLLQKNIEEFYKDIKSSLNERTYVNIYNINSLKNQLTLYKNELNRLKEENDLDNFIKIFVRITLALERFTQSNEREKLFNEAVNDFYKYAFTEVGNNLDILDKHLTIEYSYTKKDFVNRLLDVLINENRYNSKLLEYIQNKINSFTTYELFKKDKEEIEEKMFLYQTTHEVENGNFSKVNEVKTRLQLIPYRIIYAKYLVKIDDLNELSSLYYTYDNYKLYPKLLYETLLKGFDNEKTLYICEDVICNYFMYVDLEDEEIKTILNNYCNKLSNEFILNAGLSLYANIYNRKSFKLLMEDYPEYEIFYQAYKSFTSFDNRINEYSNYSDDILKKLYYLKVQEILDDDYVISNANKKLIMKYIKRLDSYENGKYYISDLIDYFYEGRYNFSFKELEEYLFGVDL